MRKKLKEIGIQKIKVIYSTEEPINIKYDKKQEEDNKKIIGSISFVPSVAGLIITSEVIKDIIKV